ncbi:lipopolysaccharide biosynthesis protein [Bdellovibrio sp. HCB290]|uniref:lipopolysaccharide biosynthesis protein n=1 Tax=Bdellovibrio sp. HCB290 TaxID=3394356 RepID=UPI0039B50716
MRRNLYYIAFTIVFSGAIFFSNFYLSKKLTVEEYGLFGLIVGAVGLLVPVVMLGQATAITTVIFSQEKKGDKNISQELKSSLLIMVIAGSIVFTFLLAMRFFKIDLKLHYEMAFVVAALSISEAFRSFAISVANAFDLYRVQLIAAICFFLILICFVIGQPTVQSYLLGMLSAGIIATGLLLLFSKNYLARYKDRSKYIFRKKELLVLGWVAIPGMLITYFNVYMDRYIVNYYFSLTEVGYYTLAATLGLGCGNVLITSLLRATTVQIFGALQEEESAKYMKIFRNAEYLLATIAMISLLGQLTVGPSLLRKLFDGKYDLAIPYMVPLFLTTLMSGMVQLTGCGLVQRKKLYIAVILNAIGVVINFCFSVILGKFFGIAGILSALSIAGFFHIVLTVIFSRKYFPWMRMPVRFLSIVIGCFSVSLFWSYV